MEQQAELEIGLGTQEPEKISLKPTKVKIVSVKIEPTTKSKKAVFECKHPDREETIHLSSVAYLIDRAVKVAGTWYNLDKEGKIQKGSALYVLLTKIDASTIAAAVGKEVDTELDNKYLCFKAY
jgi:hypothetical protein